MEEEIIAKCISRKKRAWICLRGTLVALAFLAAGLYLLLRPDGEVGLSGFVSIAAIVIGALLCLLSIFMLVKVYPFPPVIAAREGDTLVFLGERIPLCDIAEATSEQSRTLSWQPTYGLLRIRLKSGRILKNGCVDDVAQACFRLNECLRRYAAEQERQ
ncbi:MAG TPA: hypothetical protein H9812_00870 [Candidatus Gallimonas intestinigallinarum]|uniref:Uncharacterized protein n=1 Tax=Candidatus Gallimonas intestinigallinarum TaxID=2838604 RepID=A0A9D2DW10_9FIRM|nr:hypothetical protein [Candidatus Gallimonas intestinigallinarum]